MGADDDAGTEKLAALRARLAEFLADCANLVDASPVEPFVVDDKLYCEAQRAAEALETMIEAADAERRRASDVEDLDVT